MILQLLHVLPKVINVLLHDYVCISNKLKEEHQPPEDTAATVKQSPVTEATAIEECKIHIFLI